MNPILAYLSLLGAIVFEVTGSSFLLKSEQFTRLGPTIVMVAAFGLSFYCLSLALRVIPLGVAYAIWAGCGIVLTAMVAVIVFRQTLDWAAMIGIGLIVSGVVVMQAFSRSTGH